jgi:hypothetical protein
MGIAAVTLVVVCFYAGFALVAFGIHDWNPLWFVWMGERYADLDPDGRTGYDGQFIYYLARDGESAIPHLDAPAYRLQRILLPITVRLLSLGTSASVPWLLVAVNGIAIAGTSYLLAKWLDQRALSPWYALMYTLYVGTFLAFSRDLAEPLALGLAAGGAVLWLQEKRVRAALLLALAALTKETTWLFALGITFSELARGRLRLAIGSLAARLPLFAWEYYLFVRMGTVPMIAGPKMECIPLKGLVHHLNLEPGRLSAALLVGLPALILMFVSLVFLIRARGRLATAWGLLLNCAFVVLMPAAVYDHVMHAGRNAAVRGVANWTTF